MYSLVPENIHPHYGEDSNHRTISLFSADAAEALVHQREHSNKSQTVGLSSLTSAFRRMAEPGAIRGQLFTF